MIEPEDEMRLPGDFEQNVTDWATNCFGPDYVSNLPERNYRFLEEALELVQSCGMDCDAAHQVVDYVYAKRPGDIGQEVGGVVLTLVLLCSSREISMVREGYRELNRVENNISEIRKKQKSKPKGVKRL